LDVLGDRWTLLILRDLAFFGRRNFQDFLAASEGISSNILADRLRRLEGSNIIEGHRDPADRRRIRYFLTDDGLDLLPILIEMTIWGGLRHPNSSIPRERIERMNEERDRAVRSARDEHVAEREAAALVTKAS